MPDSRLARVPLWTVACAVAVTVVGLGLSFGLGKRQADANQAFARRRFEEATTLASDRLIERVRGYEHGLRGARGAVIAAGAGLSRRVFRAYHESREIDREFPGVRGFGFIRRVPVGMEDAFVAAARRDGAPDFELRESAPHEGEHDVIQYIEPSERNQAAIGFDIASEPVRRSGARQALQTQAATLTAPITLMQAPEVPLHGFLLLMPIYADPSSAAGAQAGASEAVGFAYAALVIDEILHDLDLNRGTLALALHDEAPGYSSVRFFATARKEQIGTRALTRRVKRALFGRAWILEFQAQPSFWAELNLRDPRDVFAASALTSVLLGGLLHAFLIGRHRASVVRTQRARLSTIVENSSDAIISITLEGRVVNWNQAAEMIFGIASAEARDQLLSALIGSSTQPVSFADCCARIGRGEVVKPFDAVLQRKDGTPIDVSVAAAPVTAERERIIGVGLTIRDIHERKQFERKLAEWSAELERLVDERTAEVEAARHLLRTTLDALPSMVGYWDKDLINRFSNRAYVDWFGVDSEKVPGMHIRAVLGDELLEQNRVYIDAVLRGEPQSFERSIRLPDGRGVRHSLTHYLPDIVDGTVRGFFAVVHDVTELTESRLRLAASLRENEALLMTLDRLALVSMTDRRGKITYVNEAFRRVSGYETDELIGRDHRVINSGTHPPGFWADVWRTISAGIPWRGEVCNRAKDGSLYWVDSMIAPYVGPDGKIERYISIRTDITPSKTAARELIRERERLDAILRGTGVGTFEWNVQTGELRINDRWAEMLGYRLEDLAPISIETLRSHMHKDDVGRGQAVLERHFRGELETYEHEYRMHHRDGHIVWVLDRGRVTTRASDGAPAWMHGTHQDITARHAADSALREAMSAAQAANAAKSEFLANMSHEIRTPLNAVIGLAYLLDQTELGEEQRNLLSKIQVASRSLLGVVNDVLDLSKIEAGEMALENQLFDPRELVSDLKQLLLPQAERRGLALRVHLSADIPAKLRGDPTRLRQILLNLLSNALKFTEQGSVDLIVKCATREAQRIVIRCAVRDTGIGIAPEVQERLFTPFTQADASTTRRFGGTGLGLSIVWRLAKLLGGEIGLTSKPGSGSEFWVRLPFEPATTPSDASGVRALEVLIADDSPHDRNTLASMARSLGFRAETVDSGTEMIRRVLNREQSSRRFAALLVDWRMPGLDGLQALASLAQTLDGERVPAAIIVSVAEVAEVKGAPHAELADSILTKPVTLSGLFNAINAAVVRRGHASLTQSARLDGVQAALLPGLRILVVDDSEINLEVARRILEHEGASVESCSSGQAALELIAAAKPAFEAVLMDVQMPAMDGNETTRRIRGELGLRQLPVIALTAGALVAERQRALEAGMNAFISKPLDPSTLIRIVRQQIERASGAPLPVRPRAQSKPTSTDGWPAIAGIEQSAVATPLREDVGEFLRLVRMLLDEFADFATSALPDLADRAARKRCAAQVHKLRGGASVLGAKRIFEQAAVVETALKSAAEPAEVNPLLVELRRLFHELEQDGRAVLTARETRATPGTPGANAELDPKKLEELRRLLHEQDLLASERFRELAAALRAELGDERFARLQQAVERYRFADATVLLDESLAVPVAES